MLKLQIEEQINTNKIFFMLVFCQVVINTEVQYCKKKKQKQKRKASVEAISVGNVCRL